MSEIVDKILKGRNTTDEDWSQYLVEAHRVAPSMTPAAFGPYKTSEGLTSYEMLARSIDNLRGASATVLDLACGDGYLFQFLLPILGSGGTVVGVDMSDGELAVAKRAYETNKQVQLYQAKAQSLPLPASSVDAVVSHMAFMLMLPVDPVVSEIGRILKSGGRFSAVIGNVQNDGGFFNEVQKVTSRFIDQRYPKIRETRSGDSRVRSEDGLKSLFSPSFGFSETIDISDFSLLIKTGPQGVWDLMKDMYFVSMLPQQEKDQLKVELMDFVASKAELDRTVSFDFQMRLFSVKKL